MGTEVEQHLRVAEFAEESRYKVSTVRKLLCQRKIGYRKMGRLILIPRSELSRLMGEYRPPVE